ncbi:MAG: hypothetical protein ABIK09_06910 [Pseudomonadota bacterium]
MEKKNWQLKEGCVETLWESGFLLQFIAQDDEGCGQISGWGENSTAPLRGDEIGVYANIGGAFQYYYRLDAAKGGVLNATRHPGPSGPGYVEIFENDESLIHVLEPGGDPASVPRDTKTLLFLGNGDLSLLEGMDQLVELGLVGVADLTSLPALPALVSFLVAENTEVESFEGLQRSKKVRTVKATHCPRLRDARHLNGLPELSELFLDQYTQLNVVELAMQLAAGVQITMANPLLFPPEEDE